MMRVYIDMDGVLCDFETAFARDKAIFSDTPYPQSREGFYLNLVLIRGAQEAMNYFLTAAEIDPYILTAPSVYNPLSYTEKRLWVEKYFGFDWVKRLIISPDKSLLKGDVLIDDHNSGRGQEKFEGRLIHFGSEDFPDWKSVLTRLASSFPAKTKGGLKNVNF